MARKPNEPMPGSKSRRRCGVRGNRAGKTGLKKDHHGLADRWWFGHDLKWQRKNCHRKIRQYWRAKLDEEIKAA